ncbi:MAG: hypothetical protein PWQ48_1181 [Thermotogaceae bacterium]|jgi:hypothetical protein|nr:hypothetical protein [Thermotogaceae bacterium]
MRRILVPVFIALLVFSIAFAGSIKIELPENKGSEFKLPPTKVKGNLIPEVWTDKDIYCTGEEGWIYFKMNKDPYVVVFVQNPDMTIDVVWPTLASGLNKLGRIPGEIVFTAPIGRPYKMSSTPGIAKAYIIAFREPEIPEKLRTVLGINSDPNDPAVIRVSSTYWKTLLWTNLVGRHDIAWNWAVYEFEIKECPPEEPPQVCVYFRDTFCDEGLWPWRETGEYSQMVDGELFPYDPVYLPMYADPTSHYRIEFDFRFEDETEAGFYILSDSYDKTANLDDYILYSFAVKNYDCKCITFAAGDGTVLKNYAFDPGADLHHVILEHYTDKDGSLKWRVVVDNEEFILDDITPEEWIGYFAFSGKAYFDNFKFFVFTK